MTFSSFTTLVFSSRDSCSFLSSCSFFTSVGSSIAFVSSSCCCSSSFTASFFSISFNVSACSSISFSGSCSSSFDSCLVSSVTLVCPSFASSFFTGSTVFCSVGGGEGGPFRILAHEGFCGSGFACGFASCLLLLLLLLCFDLA
jgi:hypothetical protein